MPRRYWVWIALTALLARFVGSALDNVMTVDSHAFLNSAEALTDTALKDTARAAAKVWAKLKGVDNSRSIEKTWNSGDSSQVTACVRPNARLGPALRF